MASWLIIGGMVLSAWAVLTVMAGELSRRTVDVKAKARQRRLADNAGSDALQMK